MSDSLDLRDLPFSLGEPLLRGRIRSSLEDFQVQEIPQVTPSGEGNHLWLELKKRGANTWWVAEKLAEAAGVPARDVGYAGMKDRHGVTSQWFSVALQEAKNPDWTGWDIQDVTFLQAVRHQRKLKRGALNGNRFVIVVRALDGDTAGLEQKIEHIRNHGVPNYFGVQRFGAGGANVRRGVHWLQKGGRLSRNKRSIYISAVRSFLFNKVLAERVEQQNWNTLLDGEVAMLHGSHSIFNCELPDAELVERCASFDLHPSGPLPGRGGVQPERAAGELEKSALAENSAEIEALEKSGASGARRALRLVPGDLTFSLDNDDLTLSFELPPGNYATSLLRELATCTDDGHIAEP